jgi:hypothetical protein
VIGRSAIPSSVPFKLDGGDRIELYKGAQLLGPLTAWDKKGHVILHLDPGAIIKGDLDIPYSIPPQGARRP